MNCWGGELWVATMTPQITHYSGPQWAQAHFCLRMSNSLSFNQHKIFSRVTNLQVLIVEINTISQCSVPHIQKLNFLALIQISFISCQYSALVNCFLKREKHKPAQCFSRFPFSKEIHSSSDRKLHWILNSSWHYNCGNCTQAGLG